MDAGLPRIDRITDVYDAVSVRRLIPVGGEISPAIASARFISRLLSS